MNVQQQIADAITKFAGSMTFIYIHIGLFALWCGTGLFGHDPFPFNFLTLTVSLEAIFLATFVLIGQNRQARIAEEKVEHDFHEQEELLELNTELTKKIHELTVALHTKLVDAGALPGGVTR